MTKTYCPICGNLAGFFFKKSNTLYAQCSSCRTVFCDPLDQDNKVGGKFEIERNYKENYLRVARIEEMYRGKPKEDLMILDWGCGNGYLIEDLKKAGFPNVDGFDLYNPPFSKLPESNKYHIITCIECIEHTSPNYLEIDVMRRSLLDGGCVMIETSFVDVAEQEGLPIEDFFYCAPDDGHSTIFSHHGLDLLFALKGFQPRQHFDRHVRIFQKVRN